MKLAKIIVGIGLIFFTLTLIYGFTVGDFFVEGSQLMALPWGIVSLIDVYLMFFLFAGWVIFRESSSLSALVWIISLLILGSFIAYLYTLITLIRSDSDWAKFWMGSKAKPSS